MCNLVNQVAKTNTETKIIVNHPFLFLCWSHVFLSFGPFGTASITAEPQSLATGEPQSLAILDMEGKRYHNLSKILPGKSLFVCFDIAHRHFQEPDLKYVYAYVYVYVYPPTPPRGRAPEKQGYCEFGGFPVSQVWEPLGAHSLTFFPILPYLNAFLRWRFASWPWGSLFRRFCRFCSLGGLTVSLFPWGSLFRKFCRFCNLWGLAFGGSQSSLFFPILMHSLGDVWHPGPGVPCFGGFANFAAFGGSQSHFLPYSSLS